MRTDSKKILLVGLPSTGKTTFIAALWYYVSHWDSNRTLTLNSLEKGEEEYLNSIRDKWARYEIVPRTSVAKLQGETVIMNLRNTLTQQTVILDIPDLSGETFKRHFEFREWSIEFDKMLNGICGVIIFVDPTDGNNVPKSIIQADEISNLLGEAAKISSNEKYEEWKLDFIPNQIQIVDFLQFILYHKPQIIPAKVSILISAWDKVQGTFGDVSPNSWMEKNFPLLYQFMVCNSQVFNTRYLGVSAQGVDYSDEKRVDEMASKDPLERIIIKEESEVSNDITRPIVWLTE
jgi:hypothetical protein